MKRWISTIIFPGIFTTMLVFTCSEQGTSWQPVSGSGDTVSVKGMKVLFLKGTHFERGFHHGYLLGPQIMDVFHGIIVLYLCDTSDSVYECARTFVGTYLSYESRYTEEAQGMIAGMKNAGVSVYDSVLCRDIDPLDLLVMTAVEELYNIVHKPSGCMSLSSWGRSTQKDSILRGALIITRHWDYPPINAMIRNLVLIVHIPSEQDENRWVSGTWAGMIGSCTALNTSGIGAFLDYGPFFQNEKITTLSVHHPVSLSIRNGIEQRDFNHDGRQSTDDVVHAIQEYIPYFGSEIHVVSADTGDLRALIIESDNERGLQIRTRADNTDSLGDNLAVTNHFRKLYPPQPCDRYQRVIDSLVVSTKMTFDRSWKLVAGASQCRYNVYSISYVPASGVFRWAVASLDDPRPAYERQSHIFSIDSLCSEQ
jgi:hypothetical protein